MFWFACTSSKVNLPGGRYLSLPPSTKVLHGQAQNLVTTQINNWRGLILRYGTYNLIGRCLLNLRSRGPTKIYPRLVTHPLIGDSWYLWLVSWVCRSLWNENQFVNHVNLFSWCSLLREIKYLSTKELLSLPNINHSKNSSFNSINCLKMLSSYCIKKP